MSTAEKFDVVIVGAGHNGLVAATYLAKAGLSVAVLEATASVGGATVSQQVFPDFDARLSRYSYLISLLPDKIITDLDLDFAVKSRSVASFTPIFENHRHSSLLITTEASEKTESDFADVTGGADEFKAWNTFYDEVKHFAEVVSSTLLSPLPTRTELRNRVNRPIWNSLVEEPLGRVIEERFQSDLVRGIVFTDGLIGTFADSTSFAANRCFIYHLIGNGDGQWRVPVGGMGKLVKELVRVAIDSGVRIITSLPVTDVSLADGLFTVTTSTDRSFAAKYVLSNCAPQTLAKIAGTPAPESLDGAQVKVNMLLHKLPRLKSGADPKLAFAGTFHFDEKYSQCELAYRQAAAGQIPDRIPAEMYCHTLSDKSILSPELNEAGYQTLTLFALHTPASLFDSNHDEVKRAIGEKLLAQLNEYLEDPIEECLAVAKDGSLCIEIKSPLEIEKEIGLPRGNIFHKDLSFPFREDDQPLSWGVETTIPNLFLCGAGAIRGGGVSGIPGHNAAAAVLEAEGISRG